MPLFCLHMLVSNGLKQTLFPAVFIRGTRNFPVDVNKHVPAPVRGDDLNTGIGQ